MDVYGRSHGLVSSLTGFWPIGTANPSHKPHLGKPTLITKRHKQADISEGRQERVISTQEYIRTVLEEVEVDEDFSRGPWLSAVDFVNANGGGSFIDNGKVAQVVAIIKSCSPNALDDLIVTLKDLSGSMPEAIHHKIINDEGGYGKDIYIGAAMIVHNVSVFSPNRSHNSLHYLNITKKNLVKVFHKDTLYGSGSGVAGGRMLDEEEIMKLLEEEEHVGSQSAAAYA
ncbi:hypothetical protein CTI12_AA339940 [Artemisia annua]|uniref:Homologous recombination OB-fold protein OB-fold domain-containing protein n=1 Tax=Artemisia annua TaxID=35608 RepID=A0A2U1MTW6_ARTAN|nr:hypothetical protein CTI12_AA339940 [Artemisia annua]